jgi:alpha-methylacyl-CoA racemase
VTHPQPLSGVLVLDFTTLLPGPLATLMLAEAGAEVIKIERPGGEDMRMTPPRFDGDAAVFALLNRGKKSLVLDLKNASDRNKLRCRAVPPGCDGAAGSWL